jgi:hypothetical protein
MDNSWRLGRLLVRGGVERGKGREGGMEMAISHVTPDNTCWPLMRMSRSMDNSWRLAQ